LWDEGKKRLVSFREIRRHQEQDLSVLESEKCRR
jgi:hypothetical protein